MRITNPIWKKNLNHTAQVVSHTTEQNSNLKYHELDTWFAKVIYQIITYSHLFANILCVDLLTSESLRHHKGIVMHMTYKDMHIFLYNARFFYVLQCT